MYGSCGAYSSPGDWFQLEWPSLWQRKSIRYRCDNAAAVAIVNSGSSKNDRAMHLMCSQFSFLAKYTVTLRVEHISGSENGAADALSRNNCFSFLSQVLLARGAPAQIPPGLFQVLVLKQPDWIFQS